MRCGITDRRVDGHCCPTGQPELGVRLTVTDAFDGAFRVQMTVPTDFPAGAAFAGIENWDYSACSDNASCASASVDFTVQR